MLRPKKSTWYGGVSSRHAPIETSNVGRKMLEKMGWSDGLGLGKDNQGIKEQLSYRHKVCKSGLRSKDEVTCEALPHQSAFEDLLGQLNCNTEENEDDSVSTNPSKSFKRQTRYVKMARAKDVANYEVKDLEGIIGKEATKKNFVRRYDETQNESRSEKKSRAECVNKLKNHKNKIYPDLTLDSVDHIHPNKQENEITDSLENINCEECIDKIETIDSYTENLSNGAQMTSKRGKRKAKTAYCNGTSANNINGEFEIYEQSPHKKSCEMSFEEERKWKEDTLYNSELHSEMCSQFVGSNLHQIKGYGNW